MSIISLCQHFFAENEVLDSFKKLDSIEESQVLDSVKTLDSVSENDLFDSLKKPDTVVENALILDSLLDSVEEPDSVSDTGMFDSVNKPDVSLANEVKDVSSNMIKEQSDGTIATTLSIADAVRAQQEREGTRLKLPFERDCQNCPL